MSRTNKKRKTSHVVGGASRRKLRDEERHYTRGLVGDVKEAIEADDWMNTPEKQGRITIKE